MLCQRPAVPSPRSEQAQEGSTPSVLAAIPHQRSTFQTRQNSRRFLIRGTYTSPFLFVWSSWGSFFFFFYLPSPFLRQAQVKAGELRILPLLHWNSEALKNTFYLTVSFCCVSFRRGWTLWGFCLVSCIPVKQGLAQHKQRAAKHMERQEVHFGWSPCWYHFCLLVWFPSSA